MLEATGLLLSDIWAIFRWRAVLFVVLILLTGLLDGTAMALLFPLFAHVGIGDVPLNPITRLIDDAFDFVGLEQTLGTVVLVVIGAFVVQYGVFTLQSWMAAQMQTEYMTSWRVRLFKAFEEARWSYFVANRSGDLINSIVSESVRVAYSFMLVNQVLAAIVVNIVYLTIAFIAAWQVTTMLLVTAGIVLFVTWGIVRHGEKIGKDITSHMNDLIGFTNEIFAGMKLVKASGAERAMGAQLSRIAKELARDYFWMNFHPPLLRTIFETIAVSALVGILVIGTSVINIEVGAIVVVVAMFIRLYPRVSTLQTNSQALFVQLPAIAGVQRQLDEARRCREVLDDRPLPNGIGKNQPPAIEVANLCVRYDRKPVLKSVDMSIQAGVSVGIIGVSGAGKSTLIDTLLRLVEPSSGSVTVDGCPVTDLPVVAWRRAIGYVPQETFLFNTSVRENIRFGNERVSEESIVAAAKAAHAHGFISELANGYETELGDRGVRLSGGQRQRIGLARALVGNPMLLILDEATSALDSVAEGEVMKAITKLHGTMTVIMVAHRLSTVRAADCIFVLREGKITETGTWDELLSRGEHFNELWNLQAAP